MCLVSVLVIKMSNLHQTSKADDEEESDEGEDDEEEEEDEEKKPQMTFSFIKHQGCVNRIRVSNIIISTTYVRAKLSHRSILN